MLLLITLHNLNNIEKLSSYFFSLSNITFVQNSQSKHYYITPKKHQTFQIHLIVPCLRGCKITCFCVHFFLQYEPHYEKNRLFAYAKTKTQISFAVTEKLISAFVYSTRIVQSLNFLNPKFQASSYLLWLHSPVCVGPGWKPRRPVFS